MSELKRTLFALRDALVLFAAREPMDVPKHRFDGEDMTVKDVSVALRIPIEEAAVRLLGKGVLKGYNYKDVHGGMDCHSVQVGVGTTIHQRAQSFIARRTRNLPKRKKRKRNDSSQGK